MPLTFTKIGYVLSRIYEFHFATAIYLPTVEKYSSDTACIVPSFPSPYSEAEEAFLHDECLSRGFKNWLNVALVSDICDTAPDQSEASLIAVFNAAGREGGSLSPWMNYRRSSAD